MTKFKTGRFDDLLLIAALTVCWGAVFGLLPLARPLALIISLLILIWFSRR